MSSRDVDREIPSFFILATNVVRLSPSNSAAPPRVRLQATRSPAMYNRIKARAQSLNVLGAGLGFSGFLSDVVKEVRATGSSSSDGKGFGSTPNVRVALVEASGPDDAPEINMPVAFPQLFKTKYGTSPESSSADYFAKANPTGFELADVGYSKAQTSFIQDPVACEQRIRTPLRLRFAN